MKKIGKDFYRQDAVSVAQQLLGKTLVRVFEDGIEKRYPITITEAYLGGDDLACHASKGCTPRTKVMFGEGGHIYVYLIYGMYWMLNVVTGEENHPQAVLICGIGDIKGSGRVGRELKMDKSFYGEDLLTSDRIWIEDTNKTADFKAIRRVGVDYAGEWKDKLWRFETSS
ncbi:putative 3-methyladenine DNA glycosylase [uncultured Paludibacter sp.]|uniref:Putative 3-methyladenine DNA glycosylase n=1 Tax=uncultured Paludibacter sp. TaxID=497635 RepID=A0A653AJH4_9BACT|nr:putative 3-methyladenine DNA glycosylase [uncultured Paludibacter sp.]